MTRRIATLSIALLLLTTLLAGNKPALAHSTFSWLSVADFEGSLNGTGVDTRGSLIQPGNLAVAGPFYAWENPPSPAGDDINYWDVYSDGDGTDEYVDYLLVLTPATGQPTQQNWTRFTSLQLKFSLGCDGGCNGLRAIQVFAHDADNTGNNSGGGYQNLGTASYANDQLQTPSLDLSSMSNRDQVDHLLIRVKESFFSSLNVANARQRVHMYDIKVGGTTTPPTITGSSYGGTAIARANAYDYAPSVLREGTTYKMYWCTGDTVEFSGDAIWYSTSTDLVNWTNQQQVLRRTANSQETRGQSTGHTCDPSVVKVDGTYYLYYTAAGSSGGDNRIFLATSTNGTTWTKYPSNSNPLPVISAKQTNGTYGAGQSSVFYLNGKFYHYYTDTTANANYPWGAMMLSISYDGKNWFEQNPSGVSGYGGFVVTYLWKYNVFIGVQAMDQVSTQGIDYIFSHDGINWEASQRVTGIGGSRPAIHNAGILTDQSGVVSGSPTMRVFYGAGATMFTNPNSWDIDRTDLSVQ